VTIVPEEVWARIRSEQHFEGKIRTRGIAFLHAFPSFRGILNMLRIALAGNDPALAEKAKQAFRTLSAPMEKDLRRAIADSVVRPDVDVELLAYLQLVIAEGLGYWLMMDAKYSVEEGMNALMGLFAAGLVERGVGEPAISGTAARSGELRDRRAVTFRREQILVNGEPCLPGKMGDAEVALDLAKATRVEFAEKADGWAATATLKDGSKVVLRVDGETTLSGRATFGAYHIPLKHIADISLEG
jgi:hypothetical protein